MPPEVLFSPNNRSSLHSQPMQKLKRDRVHDPDYEKRPTKKPSRKLMDRIVPLSQRVLSALIVDNGSETVDFIAEFEHRLVQFSSPHSCGSLDDRILIELQSIGLLLETVDDQVSCDSEDTDGVNKNVQLVCPRDFSEETVDKFFGLAESDIADMLGKPGQDIGSWLTVEGHSYEEPLDEAPLVTPMDELTRLNLYFIS